MVYRGGFQLNLNVTKFFPVLNKSILSIGYHLNNYRIRYDKEGKNGKCMERGWYK